MHLRPNINQNTKYNNIILNPRRFNINTLYYFFTLLDRFKYFKTNHTKSFKS